MTPPETREAATFPAAELDRRFYAFAVDRLLAWAVFVAAGFLWWRFLVDDGRPWAGIGGIVATVALVSLVYAVLLGVAGTSPGKALMGLRVVRYDDGRPVGVPVAVLRTGVLGLFTLPTLGLGLATLAWTAVMDPGGRRRGGHDRMTDAVVVDVRPVPEVEEEVDERPRQVVNLTALRLMPEPPAGRHHVPPQPERAPATPEPTPGPTPESVPPPPTPPPAPPAPSPTAPSSIGTAPRTDPGAVPPGADPPPPPPAEQRPQQEGAQAAPTSPPRAAGGPTLHRGVTAGESSEAPGATEEPVARWRVSFDTGESFVVEGLALVGRRPEPRPGEPVRHVVPLRSSDMSLSKTHAQFQVVPDGALVVMDRGSTNGSVVVRQGVSKSLTAGRPSTLVDGDTVHFGDRTMTVSKQSR